MTPTAYIVTPIGTPPDKDGAYLMMFPDGLFSNRMYEFKEGRWPGRINESRYTHYLKPVDLSRMLEEAWEAGCTQTLKDIAKTFSNPSNQDKADRRTDKDVFQAIGETIQSFPLDEQAKQTYLSSINKEK